MRIRKQRDRRTTTVRGVTGYDRRKRQRRTSLDPDVVFVPVATGEYVGLKADDLDFSIVKTTLRAKQSR